MSSRRQVAHIDAPLEVVWGLVGEPRRHPEWWPRIIEVSGERFEQGSEYAQVTKSPSGPRLTTMGIDELSDLHEIRMTCRDTGMFSHWLLTEASGGTFVEAEFGMHPQDLGTRVFDRVYGSLYFRRWLARSLAALQFAAREP